MGLTRSMKRRAALMRGEDFGTAFKVFFADRKARRAFEIEKFGRDLNAIANEQASASVKPSTEKTPKKGPPSVLDFIDKKWYAQANGLASEKESMQHYKSEGRKRALAPFPELAGSDGRTMSTWGVEYLVRMGFPVGEMGKKPLQPGDRKALDPFKIVNKDNKRIAVVTAIFGEFDALIPIDPTWKDAADFFVVSDRSYVVESGWKQVHAPFHHQDPRRRARFVKLNLPTFFSDYDWVIWIDGNVMMCRDPQTVLSAIGEGDYDFATFTHPDRKGIVSEAAKCVQLAKDDMRLMAAHLQSNQTHKAFEGDDLYETMVMVLRPSSEAVRRMCSNWWRLLSRGSKRDQMSLPLAISETPDLRVRPLPDDIKVSALFARTRHRT